MDKHIDCNIKKQQNCSSKEAMINVFSIDEFAWKRRKTGKKKENRRIFLLNHLIRIEIFEFQLNFEP